MRLSQEITQSIRLELLSARHISSLVCMLGWHTVSLSLGVRFCSCPGLGLASDPALEC